MSTLALDMQRSVELGEFGLLTPISRRGGQGRVYLPEHSPDALGPALVVKLYRAAPPRGAARALAEMVEWSQQLAAPQRELLHHLAAWPLATITSGGVLMGIAMHDVRSRFEVPFLMPSGRSADVLLQLEHLLGPDSYLRQRGQRVAADTPMRVRVAERISGAFAYMHRHGIVVSDVSPNNLLISFAVSQPDVCFIDCDSMVFRGRQALASVETGDWEMPPAFDETPHSRAADAYKLGLLVLRLLARSHDARTLEPHIRCVPVGLRELLARALSTDAPNRPPAGEWQLALRRALADRGLAQRHPGPQPAASLAAAPRPSHHDVRPVAPARAIRARGAAPARLVPSRPPAVRHNTPRGFTVAWLITGLLLLVLFAHLVQVAAVSGSDGGGGVEQSTAFPSGGPYGFRHSADPPGGYSGQEGGQAFGP